ncbi:type IV toxin-antitoxin system AbiEi family antitoxin [Candidatus Poriferisocius sp.]|uniref:type IV toxin-antitoxin system AbiEi family antitoxin n=1 Tax=Candidatus Poriferisocius sp. TaxID=3101276 RepID=UPI003B02CBDA
MGLVAARELSEWMISQERTFASAGEIARWLGCSQLQVPHRLRGARQAGEMVCVTTGGWVPARNHRIWVDSFLDEMMRYLGHPYYVGYLTAASIYGVTHQAIQTTTLATTAALRTRSIGVHGMRFARKNDLARFPTRKRQMVTGWGNSKKALLLSTPEVTLLDLMERPKRRGGHIYLNVVAEMLDSRETIVPAPTDPDAPKLRQVSMVDPYELADAAYLYGHSTRQRAGYVLDAMADYMGVEFDTDPLRSTLPVNPRRVHYDTNIDEYDREEGWVKIDDRWNVTQWREFDPDV